MPEANSSWNRAALPPVASGVTVTSVTTPSATVRSTEIDSSPPGVEYEPSAV